MSIFQVPANSSRYFDSSEQALQQPLGEINYVIHPNGYLFNEKYNANVITYDETYQTENKFQLKISIECFERVRSKLDAHSFVEIGCGQGEFVNYLISNGHLAHGYDPVCRTKSEYLTSDFFDINSLQDSGLRKVFILRCVLPHITNPFDFLDSILEKYPSALILMQHQRIEFFAKTRSWNSLMHDHVNLFTDSDFAIRYKVHSQILFANDEWQQLVIGKSTASRLPHLTEKQKFFESLVDWRKKHLASLKDYEEIFIFGSGGKGINFAYAAVKNDINIIAALDDQEKIWGKYLDTSGVEVMSPQDSRICEARGLLVVMNHNHLESARRRFSDNLQVESLMTL
jgi:hypothetical protein